MATFSGVGGILSNGASVQTVSDALVALNRSLTWQMENLDSDNVREIGGWNISQTSIASRNFDVGMSSGYDQTENVRFWAGNTDMNNAPFRVYDSGRLVATDAQISGDITMSGGSISWDSVNAPTADQTGSKPYDWLPAYGDITGIKPPWDADNTNQAVGTRLTYIDGQGIYTGTLTAQQINAINGITLGYNASILWAQLPTLPTAGQIGAKPASYAPSYSEITGSKPAADANNTYSELLYNGNIRGFIMQTDPNDGLQKLFISADYIRAGYIRGVTIDVDTTLKVGNQILVGSDTDLSPKQLQFNGTANISNLGYNLSISSSTLDFLCANINFGDASITGANFVAKFG